jgi:hypothetical protein
MQSIVGIRLETVEYIALGLSIVRPVKLGVELGELEMKCCGFPHSRTKRSEELQSV